MPQFAYGPVELYLVALGDDTPSQAVMDALGDLLESGTVNLLDFVVVSKSDAGEVTITEIETDLDLGLPGIAGDEDIEELAELLEPGRAAALVVLELAFAKTLAEKLTASGGEVLSVERVPAPVVNALVDAFDEAE